MSARQLVLWQRSDACKSLSFVFSFGRFPIEAISFVMSRKRGDFQHLLGAVLIAARLTRILLYANVSSRPGAVVGTTEHECKSTRPPLVSAAPIVLFLLAMILAATAPAVSLAIQLLVPGAYFVLITVPRDRPGTAVDANDFSWVSTLPIDDRRRARKDLGL